MKLEKQKQILIIAGPNGAGKTTMAMKYLFKEYAYLNFINADIIARGLNPIAPESEALAAGRIDDQKNARFCDEGREFCF